MCLINSFLLAIFYLSIFSNLSIPFYLNLSIYLYIHLLSIFIYGSISLYLYIYLSYFPFIYFFKFIFISINQYVIIQVNQRSPEGSTALFGAADKGHHALVRILLDHPEIDPNVRDKQGI